jgi:hypothetical protein
VVLWLNAERHVLALPGASERRRPAVPPLLLEVLRAHGIPYVLRTRTWHDPALGAEPLLTRVAHLAGPLEIVVNGQLAAVGVAHLRVQASDEVVIGQPHYLQQRFAFFRIES